ncbi:MAG: hypothetical protein CML22_03305 [Rheinheimera sp.]|nr:hypothetical protein [Rheinheimera sp.]MBM33315.1 hypothetical protein [Rheinheimera sp.]HAW94131.1 hypothetical protein [Candidatus Azambacteria bacterium]
MALVLSVYNLKPHSMRNFSYTVTTDYRFKTPELIMRAYLCYAFLALSGVGSMNAESEPPNRAATKPGGEKIQGIITLEFYNPEHFNTVELVHDTVMGGRSSGFVKAVSEPAGLRFFGRLSLANNGGFASAQFRLAQKLPVEPYRSMTLNLAADGRQYQLRLKTPLIAQGVAYVADFNSTIEQESYYFQAGDFSGRYRGRPVNNMPALNFSDVSHISIMLADKTTGAFSIVLYSISLSTAPLL